MILYIFLKYVFNNFPNIKFIDALKTFRGTMYVTHTSYDVIQFLLTLAGVKNVVHNLSIV